MQELTIMNPVAHMSARKSALAPRLSTLENKRIGLYWNGKAGGDVALDCVRQLMEQKIPSAKFTLIRSGIPGPKAKLEEAKVFDGVIGTTCD